MRVQGVVGQQCLDHTPRVDQSGEQIGDTHLLDRRGQQSPSLEQRLGEEVEEEEEEEEEEVVEEVEEEESDGSSSSSRTTCILHTESHMSLLTE